MISYPTDKDAKELIIEFGKRMYEKNFVSARDGNISVKVSPTELWATPTGVSKGFMTEDILVKLTTDGTILEQGALCLTSEIKMHLRCYNENPDINAVCHAHPEVSTSFAVAGIPLEIPIVAEAVVQLGTVPVSKYATPGTEEVPNSVAPYCKDYSAVLLANHGLLTWGKNIEQAYFRMETVEQYAKLIMNTKYIIGKANELTKEQIGKLKQPN